MLLKHTRQNIVFIRELIWQLPRKYPDIDGYIRSRTGRNGTPRCRPSVNPRGRRRKPRRGVR